MNNLDELLSIQSTMDLFESSLNINFNSILDIGFGMGGASLFYSQNQKNVTAIDVFEENNIYSKNLAENNITILNSSFEDFNSDKKYDAVLMSHVLEHIINPGNFLEKARNFINDDGWLFIVVPPYVNTLTDNHFITGWSIGSLMYLLLRTGFDIKKGHFIKHGFNVCGFVQKNKINYPFASYDLAATKDLWPIDVHLGISGDLKKVNWFNNFNPKHIEADLDNEINKLDTKISAIFNKNILGELPYINPDVLKNNNAT